MLLDLALFSLGLGFLVLPIRHWWGTPARISLGSIPRAHLGKYRGDDLTRPLIGLLLVVAMLGGSSCAGKMAPLQQVQVSHDALATAQDLEVQLCLGVPTVTAAQALPNVNHCTTTIATTIGLTDARHQAISSQFVTALMIHKALTAQAASGATSLDYATLQASINTILTIIAELQPAPQVVQLQNSVKAGQIR
jgi:hypothetical protein